MTKSGAPPSLERGRSSEASRAAGSAYERLLILAERADRDAASAARFVGSIYDDAKMPFDLSEMHTVDAEVADEMQVCLDALRSGHASLHHLVLDGDRRVQALCATVLCPRVEPDVVASSFAWPSNDRPTARW